MIEFDHVSRNYGPKLAVDRLSLTIQPGELFALLGPNGAGKTTSIKMLVGLLRPTSGTVRICGYDVVRETRQANRCVGYVPDEPYLYEKLSGREGGHVVQRDREGQEEEVGEGEFEIREIAQMSQKPPEVEKAHDAESGVLDHALGAVSKNRNDQEERHGVHGQHEEHPVPADPGHVVETEDREEHGAREKPVPVEPGAPREFVEAGEREERDRGDGRR
jgi:ABC-type Fe3+/spermidine/putrescine transport system ATPase subunit